MTLADTYQKKTDLEHILDAPDTYIGSIEKDFDTGWIFTNDGNIVHKKYKWVPGLFKIFDEGAVNMRDHFVRLMQKKKEKNIIPVSLFDFTINKLKKKLLAEREQLVSMLEQHQQERENLRISEASAERSPDPTSADGGSMAFELEKELTLDENTKHLLNQIDHALVLIKKKKYGNCENCGEPIPLARLEALPYATLRKECAELLDS